MQITLRAARVNAGLTAQQAAEKVGVRYQTIIAWEAGRGSVSVKAALALCEAYGCSISDVKF